MVHFMLTPAPEWRGLRRPRQTPPPARTPKLVLQAENFSRVHPPLQRECLLGKGRLRNGPESSAALVPTDPRQGSASLIPRTGGGTAPPSARLANGIVLWSVVPSSKLKIKALLFLKFLPLPCHVPSPHPSLIYILVLGLTQFL